MKKSRSNLYEDDDEDYNYDDDGYDYDDDGSQRKASSDAVKPTVGAKQPATKPSVAAVKQPPPSLARQPSTPTVYNNSVAKSYLKDDDAEILDSVIPVLDAALASLNLRSAAFTETIKVQQLRTNNYDVDMTAVKLKSIAPIDARIPSGGSSSTPASPGAKKGKTLVLGGGGGASAKPAPKNANDAGSPLSGSGITTTVVPTDGEKKREAEEAATMPLQDSEQPASKAAASQRKQLPKCEMTSDVTVGTSGKTNISLVVTGHVDHGKSTTIGHLLYQMGVFADRDVSKMEQAAKRAGKASFHFAWLLDQSDEERRRGVTIDSGVHAFETANHTVSVLDAPGHESYVENMASSSAQADVAMLVVSGKPDELSVGLDYGTRLHAHILRRLGVPRVIICVNKLDAVDYDEGAFRNAVEKSTEVLISAGFAQADIVAAVPMSGLAGINLTEKPPVSCPLSSWYGKDKPTLVEVIDSVSHVPRMLNFPLRFVVSDVQSKGLTGRIECGTVSVGDSILFLPSNTKVLVRSIEHSVVGAVRKAQAGDNVDILSSSDITAISVGNIGCPVPVRGGNAAAFPPCLVSNSFEAVVQTYGANARAILPGYRCVLMINACQVQATVKQLLAKMNMQTMQWSPRGGMVKMIPRDTQGLVLIEVEHTIAFERAEDCRNLGRFLIRQEGNIIGGGVIEKPIFAAEAAPAAAGAAAAAAAASADD